MIVKRYCDFEWIGFLDFTKIVKYIIVLTHPSAITREILFTPGSPKISLRLLLDTILSEPDSQHFLYSKNQHIVQTLN